MKLLTKIALILILSLLTAPVLLLKGCGNTPQANHGGVILIDPASSGNIVCLGGGPHVIPYGVTVLDKTSTPMNGVKVTVSGGWAWPFPPALYTFSTDPGGSATGYQPSPFTGETDAYGVFTFSAVIPCTRTVSLTTPVISTIATATTNGSLAASTSYCYRVSALGNSSSNGGETFASNEICTPTGSTTATNTVTVTWSAVSGAGGYRVYGRTTGAELLIGGNLASATVTFTDTGALTPSGALPVANTSLSVITNSFVDTIYVSSGTDFTKSDLTFN